MSSSVDCGQSGEANRTSFARGGPIYAPNVVGSITSVTEFKAAAVRELQSLEAELCDAGDFDDELNIDELKILTEEELVEKALEEGFERQERDGDLVRLSKCSKPSIDDNATNSASGNVSLEDVANQTNNTDSCISSRNSSFSSSETCDNQFTKIKSQQNVKTKKKRGRVFDRESRAYQLEGAYLVRVDQLAKLKKKQDEDKAAARLHSFNGSSKLAEGMIVTSEKTESMRALRYITSPLKVKSSAKLEHVPITYPEVVLCVEIYDNRITSKKTQEFLVLGTQKLTELRDNIYCLTDQLMQSAGKHDPSGYFLIEDLFFNDLRNPSAIDYSKPILDWLKSCKTEAEEKWEKIASGHLMKKQKELMGNPTASNLPSLKSVSMHDTRFCDVLFRLGAGYLYCHQGDCRHIVVIRDMRLIHPEDDQNMAAYPIRTFQTKVRYRKCSVCFMRGATKVTVDDKWAQKNPCYFCDNCYYLLHYNEDGSLLYSDFTVYDYFHE